MLARLAYRVARSRQMFAAPPLPARRAIWSPRAAGPPSTAHVDLCGQPAPGPADRFTVRRANRRIRRPQAGGAPFPGASRTLVRPHDRRVHTDHPIHRVAIVVDLGPGQDPVPGTVRGPPAQPLVTGLPRVRTAPVVLPR